jgi:toxin ParE1/3/4
VKLSPRIHKRPLAEQDLVELYAYLPERSETSARSFLAEARKAFELILNVPGIGRRWESPLKANRGLRVTTVSRRFQDYLIFYRSVGDDIEVVRVLHGARDLLSIFDSIDDADRS